MEKIPKKNQSEIKSSPIIREATYNIKYTVHEKGTRLERESHGFNPFELLGLLGLIKDEIIQQQTGIIKPDIIERRVVKDVTEK